MKAIQFEFANQDGIDVILDRGERLLIDEDLTGHGLAAQPRGKVRDRAYGGVVEPSLEPDRTERGVSLGDTDAKAELVATPPPGLRQAPHAVAHLDRHLDRPGRMVAAVGGSIEQDQQPVSDETLKGALVLRDERTETGMVLPEDAHHLLRLGGLGEGGEPAQVADDDGDLAAVALEQGLVAGGDDLLGDLGLDVAPELVDRS